MDLVTDDPLWGGCSQRQLDLAAARDELAINDIVYAELSVGYSGIEELDDMIRELGLVTTEILRFALFLAGKAFRQYRPAGGIRTGVLPDFFLGGPRRHIGLRADNAMLPDIETYSPGSC